MVTSSSASSPHARAWAPRGLVILSGVGASADPSSALIWRVLDVVRSIVTAARGRYRCHTYTSSGSGSNMRASSMPGRSAKRAILRGHGDPLAGLGDDGRLPGDRVADHRERVGSGYQQGVEPVERLVEHQQRLLQSGALGELFRYEAGAHLGVVLAVEDDAFTLQLVLDRHVVRERAVVHQALVRPDRERMRPFGGHRGFGCHPRMSDTLPAHARSAGRTRWPTRGDRRRL